MKKEAIQNPIFRILVARTRILYLYILENQRKSSQKSVNIF